MVAEATKDAKARAEAIANSTGNTVGAIRSAKTGGVSKLHPATQQMSAITVFMILLPWKKILLL